VTGGAAESLGALVIAGDEAPHIRRCLDSLAFAGERCVVLDDRSADRTETIARDMGARVVRNTYRGNVEQKRFALGQLRHDWVVALDADEALSPGLAERILAFVASSPAGVDGAELNRVTHHLGRWIRHGDFHPDWQLRVFRRAAARFEGRNPHGRYRVAGSVRRLSGDLEHRSYVDFADQVARIQEFSDVEAAQMHAAGRRFRVGDVVLRPPARFARAYLLKAGFRDGVAGFAIAAATAFHVFLKYAKLWELERSDKRS
jgi:glycosyltransferase involved in cell wall biosynthesis